MNVTFVCRECERTGRVECDSTTEEVVCPHCRVVFAVAPGTVHAERVDECVICGCRELFVRKDFSQRLGITIVAIGFVLSSIAWGMHLIFWTYGILFATALIDVVLYLTVGNLLQCYRCSAIYRGLSELGEHATFDLETHEKFRQQAARTNA